MHLEIIFNELICLSIVLQKEEKVKEADKQSSLAAKRKQDHQCQLMPSKKSVRSESSSPSRQRMQYNAIIEIIPNHCIN